jgi:ABC-type histidine transport system ATPase subunit
MLVATHEMGFAREVADRVMFLDQGRVLELGTPDELFGRPRHERLRRFLDTVLV